MEATQVPALSADGTKKPRIGVVNGPSDLAEQSIDPFKERTGKHGRKLCEHGCEYGNNDHLANVAMNAPFITCTCCLRTQYYIDMASYSSKGSAGRYWTKDLCEACGGHYVER